MAKAKSLTAYSYVLKRERDLPPAEQTRWLLRPLSYLEDMTAQQRGGENQFTTARLMLLAALVGCENFQDENGNVIEAKTETRSPLGKEVAGLAESIIDRMQPDDRDELALHVLYQGRVTEDDAKN